MLAQTLLTLLLPLTGLQEPTTAMATALRAYFAAPSARGEALTKVLGAVHGHDADLEAMLRTKSFVLDHDEVDLRGELDAANHFVATADTENPFLVRGPATTKPCALVVYVPDATASLPFAGELTHDGANAGRFVLLIPDEKRNDAWLANQRETLRHTAMLRDLLLRYDIDPDRVYMVGSGRGGHATWDVGLMRSERWAGIYPCNGGLVHEGGFAATGGVFVENGKDLTIFTAYNTTSDHGIESCRVAGRLLKQWGCRFEAFEAPVVGMMALGEAMKKLDAVVRNAHPRSITKRFNHLADGNHYWLQALDRVPKEWDPTAKIMIHGKWPADAAGQRQAIWDQVQLECARLEGAIAGNTIRVRCQGIGHLRVWLDPALIDFDAKVTIEVNGDARPPMQPKPKLDVMLQRVHETGDTSALYFDFVDVVVPRAKKSDGR